MPSAIGIQRASILEVPQHSVGFIRGFATVPMKGLIGVVLAHAAAMRAKYHFDRRPVA